MQKIGVILINLGTPEKPTTSSVRRFLAKFLSDQRVVEVPKLLWRVLLYGIILPLRCSVVAKNYQKIWSKDGSPLRVILQKQVAQLEAYLERQYPQKFSVHFAMCYGQPSIKEVAQNLKDANIWRFIILPLYPQYSATTTAAVMDQFWRVLSEWRNIPTLRYIKEYASEKLYIQALAESIRQHWQQSGQTSYLVFSFHGIPQKNVTRGDPYPNFCERTTMLCAEELGLSPDQYVMCYQSRFGYSPWLQPYTSEILKELPGAGIKEISVCCPGFSADCLETLEEMADLNRAIFFNHGGTRYDYIPALNDSEKHIELFAELVKREALGWV